MIHIHVYSHGMRVIPEYASERMAIERFCRGLIQFESKKDPVTKQPIKTAKAVYATTTEDRRYYGLLATDLGALRVHLDFEGINSSQVKVTEHRPGKGKAFAMHCNFEPRDEQQKQAVDFICAENEITRVIHAATGFGKTFCGFYSAAQLGVRTGFIMNPGHIKTWVKCLDSYLGMGPKDVLVIQGSAALETLFEMQRAGRLTHKFIFFSAVTLQGYMNDWECAGTGRWDVDPMDLCDFLEIGYMVKDEVHESIHLGIKQAIYTNCNKVLYLSATLVSDDQFVNRMYQRIFPEKDRWESEKNQHICVRSIHYELSRDLKIRFMTPMGYSHVLYEKSIMKHKKLRDQYIDFACDCMYTGYVEKYQEGLKCIFFAATVDMCKAIAKRFKERYGRFSVASYTAETDEEVLYNTDVIISTPKSAGTGVDIPNLSEGFLSVALGSTQLSRQIMGRLRPIKRYPDRNPFFYYLTCRTIPAHMVYDGKRKLDSIGRSKNFDVIHTGVVLTGK